MASVLLSDVIIPDIYLSYQAVDSPEKSLLVTSGVVVSNPLIQQLADAAGTTGTVPFWQDLDTTQEPNYSTDSPSDVAVPDKVTASDMSTRKAFVNKGYSSADLVAEVAGSDPMQRIRNRFGVWWKRQFQHRLIAMMTGIYNANVANNVAGNIPGPASFAGDMIVNIAVDAIANQSNNTRFTRAAFVQACFTMGDMFDQITTIVVHSAVYRTMVDNDDIAFIRPSKGTTEIPYFMGKLVLVDDTMPMVPGATDGFKYTCYMFGGGCIGYAAGAPPVPVEVYRRPDQGNGAGIEQLWERKTWLMHPFGYNWTNNTVTGQSPTNANMALGANWSRVVARKNVPLAFLVVNA